MGGALKALAGDVLDLFYPPACAVCGESTAGLAGCVICPECIASLIGLSGPICPRCASPLEPEEPCAFCLRLDPELDRVSSAFWFAGQLPNLVHALKYRGRYRLAAAIAELILASPACREALESADVIAPVPLHRLRHLKRGYNQSERLAAELAGLTGKTFEPGLLVRMRNTRTQTRLNVADRKKNVQGAFKVRDHTLVAGRAVCIVDDVMTTGATSCACAAALKNAGAVEVTALTFARA